MAKRDINEVYEEAKTLFETGISCREHTVWSHPLLSTDEDTEWTLALNSFDRKTFDGLHKIIREQIKLRIDSYARLLAALGGFGEDDVRSAIEEEIAQDVKGDRRLDDMRLYYLHKFADDQTNMVNRIRQVMETPGMTISKNSDSTQQLYYANMNTAKYYVARLTEATEAVAPALLALESLQRKAESEEQDDNRPQQEQ